MLKGLLNMAGLMFAVFGIAGLISWFTILIIENKRIKKLSVKWSNMINPVGTYICRLSKIVWEDVKHNWIGQLLLIVAIVLLFILSVVCATRIPLEQCDYWNVFEKFIGNHPLFTNICGTFLGIVIIFIILRPRFVIEPQLGTLQLSDGKHMKIKLKNIGIFPVHNVKVQLQMFKYIDTNKEDRRTKLIEIRRSDTPLLRGCFAKRADKEYGCATEMTIREIREEWKKHGRNHYEGILCRVNASHTISGITYVREHIFTKNDVDVFLNRYCSETENMTMTR